nr:MAG TPA: hypothetical protein [Caudoviricetes sp.]
MIPYASQVRILYKARQKLCHLPVRNQEWYVIVALAITKAVNHGLPSTTIEAPMGVDVTIAEEDIRDRGYNVFVDEYRNFTISWD